MKITTIKEHDLTYVYIKGMKDVEIVLSTNDTQTKSIIKQLQQCENSIEVEVLCEKLDIWL